MMQSIDQYQRLIRLAELAAGGDTSALDESLETIRSEFPSAAIPIFDSPVDQHTIIVYVRRAILGDMTIRMHRGDRQAFADLELVHGDLLRDTAGAVFGGSGAACMGETVSDLVQSAYRQMLEYADSGRLRNDERRESLRGLHHVIVKRAVMRKRRRSTLDVMARAHRRASAVRVESGFDGIEYADFVERALDRGEQELGPCARDVLAARLRDPGTSLRSVADSMGVDHHKVKNAWSREVKPFLRSMSESWAGGDDAL
ncbi:MAG: hypothetical protein KC996_11210 [Phycisphaerales bacterium]|nr:hypothetical protein [Phycisphaerales bacterium]